MELDKNKIATDVATNLIEDSIKGAWGKVKAYFVDADAQDAIDYGDAFEDYLKRTKKKNSKIKTLIYRHVPQDLSEFYECVGIRCNGKRIETDSINNVLELSSKIIITGTGGIGKSVLLKHLFLSACDDTSFVPILLELRSLNVFENKDISLFNILYDQLLNNGFKMEKKYFEYSLEKGAYIILLDGFDEVNSDKMNKISQEIKDFGSKYLENKYIITSRPSDMFLGWEEFTEAKALTLTKDQALSLIDKLDFDEKVKTIFSRELDSYLYDKYVSFASNPLLLTIMLLTFDSRASIPDRLNDFYEQAFSTLFNMHDATKDAYVRDIRSGLSCEDFKMIFAYICFKSYFKQQYEFSDGLLNSYIKEAADKFPHIEFNVQDMKKDLVQSVCMLIKEGIEYKFSHRSFQEYFAAWYTCKLTDDIQHKLVTTWMKEADGIVTDEYFRMLFNLQSEKVNKIILVPGLKRVKALYEEKGYSIELLIFLFKQIIIRRKNNRKLEDKSLYRYSLTVKDQYLCNVIRLTCECNRYDFKFINTDAENNLAQKLTGNSEDTTAISFQEAKKIVSEDEILNGLLWFKRQLEFAISILPQYENNSISNKRKVSTILDEL